MAADTQHDRTIIEAMTASRLSENDKRRFRLALATTLLADGYFGFDRGSDWHGQLWWFDEYDVDLGDPNVSYRMPNSYRIDRYGNGLYSREFENGTVIVNPTDSPVNIAFNTGNICRDASTGKSGRFFTIPANDGRIYIKE